MVPVSSDIITKELEKLSGRDTKTLAWCLERVGKRDTDAQSRLRREFNNRFRRKYKRIEKAEKRLQWFFRFSENEIEPIVDPHQVAKIISKRIQKRQTIVTSAIVALIVSIAAQAVGKGLPIVFRALLSLKSGSGSATTAVLPLGDSLRVTAPDDSLHVRDTLKPRRIQ